MNPIILIPARMASTRLPGKPLADIGGVPMIVRVWRQAVAAGVGPVVVAAAEREIAEAVEAAGGRAVLTAPDLPSGSDRIFAALEALDSRAEHDVVINLQGDLPALDPEAVRAVVEEHEGVFEHRGAAAEDDDEDDEEEDHADHVHHSAEDETIDDVAEEDEDEGVVDEQTVAASSSHIPAEEGVHIDTPEPEITDQIPDIQTASEQPLEGEHTGETI